MPNTVKKKKPSGRPTKQIKKLRVSFTLSPEMRDKVDMIARANKSSISSIIETLLQQTPDDFKVVPKRSYNRKQVEEITAVDETKLDIN
jgi:predicted transcriptional regulator